MALFWNAVWSVLAKMTLAGHYERDQHQLCKSAVSAHRCETYNSRLGSI